MVKGGYLMKDFIFLNVSFIITYLSLFLFKTDIFIVVFFFYLLIINFYYFAKIEKLNNDYLDLYYVLESYKEAFKHEREKNK